VDIDRYGCMGVTAATAVEEETTMSTTMMMMMITDDDDVSTFTHVYYQASLLDVLSVSMIWADYVGTCIYIYF